VAVAVAIVVATPVAIVLNNRTAHGTAAQPVQEDTMPPIATLEPSGSPTAARIPSVKPSGSAPASKGPGLSQPSNAGSVTTQPSAAKAAHTGKPVAHTLVEAFNNVGVTDDANTTAGNFDGGGATYSAQALAADGAAAGKALTVGGVALTWPRTAGTGRKDNAIAAGQSITVSGSGSRLAFLMAADYGAVSGSGQITYTDGTTQTYTLSSADWLDADPTAVVVAAYQNRAGAERYDRRASVFGATVTLSAGKTVASVRLPAVGTVPAREGTTTLHIFAARIG
jgi:hypothetical protein